MNSEHGNDPSDDFNAPHEEQPREAPYETMSALQMVDAIVAKLPQRHPVLLDMVLLRDRVAEMEALQEQAHQALKEYDKAVEQLRSPALRLGTFLRWMDKDEALISVNGTEYVCRIDPAIPFDMLQSGKRVLCNEAYAVVREIGYETNGPVVQIEELLSDGRIRVCQESGLSSQVVIRSALLAKEKLKVGLELRLDSTMRVALEVMAPKHQIDRTLYRVEELPWSAVGGQDKAVEAIRETIETPFLHPELFERFDHPVPKGFLLYGPPGCGKTLLGKATAYNLRAQLSQRLGAECSEHFLHVKGPEILNMWVGESERQIRDLFTQCREKAREGALAFIFIDEAESILGTRHGGRFNNLASTLVPMFCTEMDGLESLRRVIVILASNRADLIDPAILRPGRIDRKIRVTRPDQGSAERIYSIYLRENLPLAESGPTLAAIAARAHYARNEDNRFLEVTYRSGKKETLYRGDLSSGAIIEAIVQRSKTLAIRRAIESGKDEGITAQDLLESIRLEYSENDLFPSNEMTEDWLKLTDFDPDQVVRLRPVRSSRPREEPRNII